MSAPTLPLAPLCALVLSLAVATQAVAGVTYLQANFDDKPLDQPIGEGGPTVGEPVEADSPYLTTAVRDAPMPTPSLELTDISDCCAGYVRFGFLDEAEITTGTLVLSADLWIPVTPDESGCSIGLRERESSAFNFADLHFSADGILWCGDDGGSLGQVGTYSAGVVIHVLIEFNLDAGTYDVRVDDQLLVDDQPHDVVGVGVGSVLISCTHDPNTGDSYCFDNIFVGDFDPTPVAPPSWGNVKARFGGNEPADGTPAVPGGGGE